MNEQKPTYFTILPAPVRYDDNLSCLEKILYSEIVALTNMNGVCTATNNYFANLYNKNDKYISSCINKLSKLGHVRIENDNNIRKIYVGMKKYENEIMKEAKQERDVKLYLEKVWLTDEEHKKLFDQLGEEITDTFIQRLNDYIIIKGKNPYKNHYLTILNWYRKDRKKYEKQLPKKQIKFKGDYS